jgi:hypothetical protein
MKMLTGDLDRFKKFLNDKDVYSIEEIDSHWYLTGADQEITNLVRVRVDVKKNRVRVFRISEFSPFDEKGHFTASRDGDHYERLEIRKDGVWAVNYHEGSSEEEKLRQEEIDRYVAGVLAEREDCSVFLNRAVNEDDPT